MTISQHLLERVTAQYMERAAQGLETYGQSMDREDLSLLDWVRHAKFEAMDLVLYLEKLEETLNSLPEPS